MHLVLRRLNVAEASPTAGVSAQGTGEPRERLSEQMRSGKREGTTLPLPAPAPTDGAIEAPADGVSDRDVAVSDG